MMNIEYLKMNNTNEKSCRKYDRIFRLAESEGYRFCCAKSSVLAAQLLRTLYLKTCRRHVFLTAQARSGFESLRYKTPPPWWGSFWRRVRDSNPRGREPKRFSRPPRYDHFDNSPYQKSTLMGTFLAQKEGFEPSRAFYTPTPLAGEPLRPLGYFCTMPLKYNSIAQRHCQEFSQQMRT